MKNNQPSITHSFNFALPQNSAFDYHLQVDGQETFSAPRNFLLKDLALPRALYRPLDELEADLRDVCLALHLADRTALRKPFGVRDSAGQWWPRYIKMKLAVRNIDRWQESAVQKPLLDYLPFNTSDKWELEFVPREAPATSSELQRIIEFKKREFIVALWSGGLDSAAGLADQMHKNPEAKFLLISVNSNARLTNLQESLLQKIPSELQARITHVPIHISLQQSYLNEDGEALKVKEEKSLRTRGLLFLTCGAIAARMANSKEFFAYENGIGALNLPFNHAHLAGYTSRAVHPHSLALFSQFATALFRQPIAAINPYLFTTKGEMCKALDELGWRDLIALSFTCSHPQRTKGGIKQCGICTSCILRRQSLRVAGLSAEDTAPYLYPLHRPEEVPAKKRQEWAAMHDQRTRLINALKKGHSDDMQQSWFAMVREFPELEITRQSVAAAQNRSPLEVGRDFLRLFQTYVDEGLDLAPAQLTVLPSEITSQQTHKAA